MRTIEQDAPEGAEPSETLTLPFDLRQKSRLRAKLDSGDDVAVHVERGRILRDGDLLLADDGAVVRVRAADEQVSVVTATDGMQLARGAYHLGNRHVPLQVGDGFLRYQHDHVLDGMVRGLGLSVSVESAPFEPEGGAYGGGGHGHAQEHEHEHEHERGGRA